MPVSPQRDILGDSDLFNDLDKESMAPIDEKLPTKSKRSQYHNFQKHLITTIRRAVSPRFSSLAQPYQKAGKEVWSVFTGTKKYTKEFLLAVTNSTACPRILEKYNLFKIYQTYGETVYREVQKFIRNEILCIFHSRSLEEILHNRRLEKKKEFEEYLRSIINELEEGDLQKRFDPLPAEQSV